MRRHAVSTPFREGPPASSTTAGRSTSDAQVPYRMETERELGKRHVEQEDVAGGGASKATATQRNTEPSTVRRDVWDSMEGLEMTGMKSAADASQGQNSMINPWFLGQAPLKNIRRKLKGISFRKRFADFPADVDATHDTGPTLSLQATSSKSSTAPGRASEVIALNSVEKKLGCLCRPRKIRQVWRKNQTGRMIVNTGQHVHRAATAFDLLYDLLLVEIMLHVIDFIGHCECSSVYSMIGTAMLLFFPLFQVWEMLNDFMNRYHRSMAWDVMIYAGIIVSTMMSVRGIHQCADKGRCVLYFLGCGLSFFILSVCYCFPATQNRSRFFRNNLIRITSGLLQTILWLSMTTYMSFCRVLWHISIALGFVFVPLANLVWPSAKATHEPLHQDLFMERCGLLVIILLGGIIAVGTSAMPVEYDSGTSNATNVDHAETTVEVQLHGYPVQIFSAVVSIFIKLVYFNLHKNEAESLWIRSSRVSGMLFEFFYYLVHVPLSCSMIGLSVTLSFFRSVSPNDYHADDLSEIFDNLEKYRIVAQMSTITFLFSISLLHLLRNRLIQKCLDASSSTQQRRRSAKWLGSFFACRFLCIIVALISLSGNEEDHDVSLELVDGMHKRFQQRGLLCFATVVVMVLIERFLLR